MPQQCAQFDSRRLEAKKSSAVVGFLSRYPQRVIAVLRRISPVWSFRLFNIAFVLGYDEVREVLTHDGDFPVGWGHKMKELTERDNFVLGMPHDAAYSHSYEQLARAFPRSDVKDHVKKQAAAISERIVREQLASKPEFDAVEALIAGVPAHMCESYYGIGIANKTMFARWTLAISAYLFGFERDDEDAAQGRAAADCVRTAIRRSIAEARGGFRRGIVLPRMLAQQPEDPSLDDERIVAQLFGMVLGFIPTNVLAGGNVLETLLQQPAFLERTRAAALAGDDDLLWRCLRETLRFRHINLGPWRTCPNGYTFGAGGPRPVRVAPCSKVVASIQSGMFDERRVPRPHSFDPDRSDEDYMVFGVGQHWCLGAYIAAEQLTQTFKALLSHGRLHPIAGKAGHMQRFNNFPLHQLVRLAP